MADTNVVSKLHLDDSLITWIREYPAGTRRTFPDGTHPRMSDLFVLRINAAEDGSLPTGATMQYNVDYVWSFSDDGTSDRWVLRSRNGVGDANYLGFGPQVGPIVQIISAGVPVPEYWHKAANGQWQCDLPCAGKIWVGVSGSDAVDSKLQFYTGYNIAEIKKIIGNQRILEGYDNMSDAVAAAFASAGAVMVLDWQDNGGGFTPDLDTVPLNGLVKVRNFDHRNSNRDLFGWKLDNDLVGGFQPTWELDGAVDGARGQILQWALLNRDGTYYITNNGFMNRQGWYKTEHSPGESLFHVNQNCDAAHRQVPNPDDLMPDGGPKIGREMYLYYGDGYDFYLDTEWVEGVDTNKPNYMQWDQNNLKIGDIIYEFEWSARYWAIYVVQDAQVEQGTGTGTFPNGRGRVQVRCLARSESEVEGFTQYNQERPTNQKTPDGKIIYRYWFERSVNRVTAGEASNMIGLPRPLGQITGWGGEFQLGDQDQSCIALGGAGNNGQRSSYLQRAYDSSAIFVYTCSDYPRTGTPLRGWVEYTEA